MTLQKLEIQDCRNLQNASLEFSPSHNLLLGANASGKTSVLEAIHILSNAKSFRSTALHEVSRLGSDGLTLSAVLDAKGFPVRIGLRKVGREAILAKRDGVVLKRVSDLTELLPIVLVDASSFQLIEAGPGVRRDYLNLGMFHVEHSFLSLWKKFSAAHKQRNALLKNLSQKRRTDQNAEELQLWNEQFCHYSELLHAARQRFIDGLLPYILRILLELGFDKSDDLMFSYRPGWNTDKGLDAILMEHQVRELSMGLTLYGPHKADLAITNKQLFSRDFLSRGQKKLLVYAMRFALSEYISDKAGKTPLLLLDDLPSELDLHSCSAVCRYLQSSKKAQTVITAVSNSSSVETIINHLQPRMFHVEHGQVSSILNERNDGL